MLNHIIKYEIVNVVSHDKYEIVNFVSHNKIILKKVDTA